MGNSGRKMKSADNIVREMSRSETFSKVDGKEPLPTLQNLALECSELRDMVDDLSEAIEDIFEEREEPGETTTGMESRLQAMTRDIQLKIHTLHKYLERHSRAVGVSNNQQVMTLVRHLVSIVNNYMTMLMKNIRKLKQMLQEMQLMKSKTGRNPQQQPSSNQVDVIPEQLDVDSMLMQLTETELSREELERDIVCVLVYWRDFKEFVSERDDSIEKIESHVQEAADSVARGLSQLEYQRDDNRK